MKDEVHLERLKQPEVEARLKTTQLAVLAPGSVEQHGPHLPLGTDAFAAMAIAEAVAQRLSTVLVPLPLVGVSPYHQSWSGSLSLHPATFIAVIEDVCGCMAQHGVDKLLFVNWHEGNSPALRLAGDSVQRKFNVRVVIAESHLVTNKLFGERAQLTHAGNMETAAVMIYDPSLVDLSRADNPSSQSDAETRHAVFRRKDVFPIMLDFHEVASTGWYGRPAEATLELAQEIREKVSEYIAEQARIVFNQRGGWLPE